MLSDREANYVMQMIEAIEEDEARGHEDCMLMLKHLYELHRLRDQVIGFDVYHALVGYGEFDTWMEM